MNRWWCHLPFIGRPAKYVKAPCLSAYFVNPDASLQPSARQILLSTLGAEIELVGSPDEEFRGTCQSTNDAGSRFGNFHGGPAARGWSEV